MCTASTCANASSTVGVAGTGGSPAPAASIASAKRRPAVRNSSARSSGVAGSVGEGVHEFVVGHRGVDDRIGTKREDLRKRVVIPVDRSRPTNSMVLDYVLRCS
jgi:hypothetical protein